MKTIFLKLFLLAFLLSIFTCRTTNQVSSDTFKSDDNISVEYPEVYELANIVLALTEYGITDKWQVRKDFAYYDEMRSYFKPFEDHPLLDSVNFSTARWMEFLSYRTDAYAFVLNDNNELERKNDFQSFEIKSFDQHKTLTEDFVKKSNFSAFFNNHKAYYKSIINNYKKAYMLSEMKSFLTSEFDDFFTNSQYSIVISPFVYAQNLHRNIDSTWTADFSPIAKSIIEGKSIQDIEEKVNAIHTLFTEMDHGYVNPTTDNFNISASFDEQLWDEESGYAGGGNAVFNEYMTWAVFDIFNSIHFPEVADKLNLNWHFQNDTRGFPYSNLFGEKVKELYFNHKGKKKIKDLYPELLAWTKEIQNSLSKPLLLNDSDTLKVSLNKQLIEFQFSEPMAISNDFDIVLQFGQWDKTVVAIGNKHNIKWTENGKKVSFEITLPNKSEYYLLLNWWGVQNPLKSKKGISLQATSGLVVSG